MNEPDLEYLFHPKSIAIAGISSDPTKFSGGRQYMQSLLEAGYSGKIYPINPKGGEALGSTIYPSIKDIPDSVDYVISSVPAQGTPQLIADSATKGVKAIHLFSAGFSEVEDEKGKQLESEVVKVAWQHGIRLIGPNCMGIYCPRTGLSFSVDYPRQDGFPRRSGPLGFMSQSGGHSIFSIRAAPARGIYFSKVISYGNACDLNETDFLQYLADDPETEIIAAYIEGIKDGTRFLTALKRATKLKPVILFKGGATESGTRATASHTGSMSGSNTAWQSILKQTGAIEAHSVEEIIDISLAFLRMPLPKGRNTAIIGMGGGAGVQAADECSNARLTSPTLPVEIKQKLKEIYLSEAGHIFRNPVDIIPFSEPEILVKTFKMIADWDQIDLVIIHISFDTWSLIDRRDRLGRYIDGLLKLHDVLNKAMAVALHSDVTDDAIEFSLEVRARLCEAGFAVYPSTRRAASAINKRIQYHEWRERNRAGDS